MEFIFESDWNAWTFVQGYKHMFLFYMRFSKISFYWVHSGKKHIYFNYQRPMSEGLVKVLLPRFWSDLRFLDSSGPVKTSTTNLNIQEAAVSASKTMCYSNR